MNKRIFYQLSRLITLPPLATGHNPFIPLIWPRLSCIIYYTRFLYPTYSTVIHSYFIPIQPSLSRIIFRHIFVFFIMNTVCISIISIIVAKYNNPRTSDQSFRSISTFLQQLSDHSVNIFIRKISFPRTSSISPRAKNARVTIPIAPYKTRVKKRVEWPKASRKWSGKDHGKGRQSARAAVTTLRDVLAWCSGETRARGWKGVEKGRISGDGWCELNHGGRFSVYVGRIRNFQPSPISRYTLLHGNKIYAEKFSFNLNPGFSSGEQRYPQWNCKTIRFIVEYRCSIVKYCRVIALGRPRFTGNEMFHASRSFFISIGRIFTTSQSWIFILRKLIIIEKVNNKWEKFK